MFVYIVLIHYLCNVIKTMESQVIIRINNIDIKDYIRMRFGGLPTSVKWRQVKNLIMSNGLTFNENCSLYRKPTDEVLISEPSRNTLKEIKKVFNYGSNC